MGSASMGAGYEYVLGFQHGSVGLVDDQTVTSPWVARERVAVIANGGVRRNAEQPIAQQLARSQPTEPLELVANLQFCPSLLGPRACSPAVHLHSCLTAASDTWSNRAF